MLVNGINVDSLEYKLKEVMGKMSVAEAKGEPVALMPDEVRRIINEVQRLRRVEEQARSYLYHVDNKREAGAKLDAMIKEGEIEKAGEG